MFNKVSFWSRRFNSHIAYHNVGLNCSDNLIDKQYHKKYCSIAFVFHIEWPHTGASFRAIRFSTTFHDTLKIPRVSVVEHLINILSISFKL